VDDYALFIKGHGHCAWYHAHQLTLIESGRADILQAWESEILAETELKGNLDWIFANGPDVLKSAHGASVQALANSLYFQDLWGSHGEGFTYYSNALTILSLASPFLLAKDLEGWLKFCSRVHEARRP